MVFYGHTHCPGLFCGCEGVNKYGELDIGQCLLALSKTHTGTDLGMPSVDICWLKYTTHRAPHCRSKYSTHFHI